MIYWTWDNYFLTVAIYGRRLIFGNEKEACCKWEQCSLRPQSVICHIQLASYKHDWSIVLDIARSVKKESIGLLNIPNIFVTIRERKRTRGHEFSLVKGQRRLDVRQYSFSQRTIHVWNKLSTDCVPASSANMFKNRIDKYLVKAGYT